MARKRSLKDAAADPSTDKKKVVLEEEVSAIEDAKTPNAGRKKAAVARKRSLKDAAADQLVEKNKDLPEAPVAPIETPVARPRAGGAAAAEPAEESAGKPQPFAEAPKTHAGAQKGHPGIRWIAPLILIGFAGGYFFGVGQAIGPANLVYLLIGFVVGYFFGRFYKVI